MIIYPAIDIIDGNCVRLTQGKFDNVTVYEKDPVKVALRWEESGAEFIHVVDLDGALKGKGINRKKILEIANTVKIPVQTGGGIRSMEDADELISGGVSRIILGTAALKNPDFVREAVKKYGEKIAVGIDAKDGFVATEGWENVSDTDAVSFAKEMEKIGVKHIIYTDIATDGMLSGPNFAAMKQMSESVSSGIIASGGVGSEEDIINLIPTGVDGVIVGKALYTGRVNLENVLKTMKNGGK